MTLMLIAIGSAAFAGIAVRFASRMNRRAVNPFPVK
jgi:hypothetical protein